MALAALDRRFHHTEATAFAALPDRLTRPVVGRRHGLVS